MSEALKKLKKLRGRSLDELRVRGAQTFAAYTERRGWSARARVPTDASLFKMIDATRAGRAPVSADGLLDHFKTRASPNFFPAFADPEATRNKLQRNSEAEAEGNVVQRANRVAEGRFDLLGLRDLYFGEPIDWHLDPVSGKRSPLTHWSRIGELDAKATGDKKIVWELNRHQHFLILGRAYWHTGDERYAQVFVAHLNSWMDQNPPKLGVNWMSSLEVAFRAVAWLWGLYFFKESPHLTPPVYLRALKFLHLHAGHLDTYLSTYYSPNTHLTGEALGLFYLGTLLPEFRRAARWRAAGRRILLAELERHVRPDGVYFEQSSYYHRYTTDFYTHLYVLAAANGETVENNLKSKLTALLDHLMYITRPDGTTPLYGDDDGGRLVMLDERAADDFRSTLATGAVLFNRPNYKYVAGRTATEETLWLLGSEGLEKFDRLDACPPEETSRAFTNGGYYVMRDNWTNASNYLLVDCGPHGAPGGAHGHADALAFDLAARGRTLLVDPGTYTYTGSAEMRDLFRSSAAHNTLTIDGESSSVTGGPFSWERVARSRVRRWMNNRRFDFFEGEHDGYMRLATGPATHARGILLLKRDYWVMRDRVATAGAHRYDIHFHFVPDAELRAETDGDARAAAVTCESGEHEAGLDIFAFAWGGEWRKETGWVSRCYGERAHAPVYTFSKAGEGAQEFFTFLVPRQTAGEVSARVREIEAKGGRAFEAQIDGAHDVLTSGSGSAVETERIASDFEWAWARFDRSAVGLKELVLLNGRRFHLDGQEFLRADGRVDFVAARFVESELYVETETSANFTITPRGVTRVVLNGETFTVKPDSAIHFVGGILTEGAAEQTTAEILV